MTVLVADDENSIYHTRKGVLAVCEYSYGLNPLLRW
jgi:hypothetical protein